MTTSGHCGAVVIAAPSSGSGKTTVATGLMGALAASGYRVAPFKVGPDYIDPGYHTLAARRPGRNLDAVLTGADQIVPLFVDGARDCDIAVIEGVMGLFDGRIDDDVPVGLAEGSTAQVAQLLGAPVILVIDATGHGQSIAALIHGFRSFHAGIDLAGVILNRVGSDRHEQVLRQACESVGMAVLGVVGRDRDVVVPSRHLGLVPAAERSAEATRAVDAMTRLIAGGVDLAAVTSVARQYDPPVDVAPPRWRTEVHAVAADTAPRIAVAGGAAFTFGYAEQDELLQAAGCEVVRFDPLTDRLPGDVDAIVIGGGFPEEHADRLAANSALSADLRAAADAGCPIYAECAGMLYLATELDGTPMAGVLGLRAHFGTKLTLGYRDAVALADSPMFRAGERVHGHEFHRTSVELCDVADKDTAGEAAPAWGWRRDGHATTDGVVSGSVIASYLHTHPAGTVESWNRFIAAAVDHLRRRRSQTQ